MVPAAMVNETSRLACTAPNDLSMPRSSMNGTGGLALMTDALSGLLRHVIRDLDLARDDVGARLPETLLHLGGDELAVVVVERPAHPALGDTEHAQARLPGVVLGGLERLVHGEVDALDHGGQDRARLQVVLVGVDADREPAL